MKRHRTEIQVRFADTDALGHINNAVYATYAELGRVEFMRALGIEPGGFILARLALDYRRQVRLGERVSVETWVERVGNTSVTMRQVVLAGGGAGAAVATAAAPEGAAAVATAVATAVAAEVEAVAVTFDYATNGPVRVPDRMRELFRSWQEG